MKRRPREPTIFAAVGNYDGRGAAKYIAHVVDVAGNVHVLGAETTSSGNNNSAENHPDQQFWPENRGTFRSAIGAALRNGGISRIEIDCTLLPCVGDNTRCVYRVPSLVKAALASCCPGTTPESRRGAVLPQGFRVDSVPLRIFSHRPEGPGRGAEVIFCLTGDSNNKLDTCFANRESWMWVAYSNTYLGPVVTVAEDRYAVTPNLT